MKVPDFTYYSIRLCRVITSSDINGTIHTWELNTGKVYRDYDIEYQYNKHSDYLQLYWTSRTDSLLDYIATREVFNQSV